MWANLSTCLYSFEFDISLYSWTSWSDLVGVFYQSKSVLIDLWNILTIQKLGFTSEGI